MKIDLKDPAVWAELERQAYDGTVDVSRMPAPAYQYFSKLAALYRAYRFDGLPKEEAENEKRLLLRNYHRQVQEIQQAREVYAEYQNAVRTAELKMSECEKAKTPQEIARIACEIVGLLTGDSSFAPRQMRKLEGGECNG